MDDLISRAAAIRALASSNGDYLDALERLEKIPAVDVTPVVHGRWIYENEGMGDYSHCSECGFRVQGGRISDLSARYKFCPNCGALMYGERRDSE